MTNLLDKIKTCDVENYNTSDICNITTGKLNANAKVDNGKYPFFTCDANPYRINDYAFDTSAILISGNGSQIGHVNIYEGKFNAYQRTYVLYDFINVEKLFIYHYMKCNIRKYIARQNSTSSIPYITLPILQNFSIPIPTDINIQKEIGETLTSLDDYIDILEKLCEKKKLIKEGALNSLFATLKSCPHKPLGEIAEYFNGLTYSPNNISNNGKIVLRSCNIQNNSLCLNNILRVNCNIADKIFVKENDVLMCSRNGSANLVGKVALIKDIYEPMCFGAFMMIIRSNIGKYLLYYFQTDIFKKEIKKESATATINQITNKMLNKVSVPIPPIDKQKEIADILSSMDKEIELIEEKINKYKSIKEGLMNDIFTLLGGK